MMKRVRNQERCIQKMMADYAKMPKSTFQKSLLDMKQLIFG